MTSTSECSYEWGDYRGGRLRVIASIEEPAVIERILKHLGRETWASANQGLSWPGLAMFRGSFYFASLAFNSSGQDEQKHSFKPLLYLSHRHRRGTSYFAHNSVYGNKFIFEKLNINFCNIYTYSVLSFLHNGWELLAMVCRSIKNQ